MFINSLLWPNVKLRFTDSLERPSFLKAVWKELNGCQRMPINEMRNLIGSKKLMDAMYTACNNEGTLDTLALLSATDKGQKIFFQIHVLSLLVPSAALEEDYNPEPEEKETEDHPNPEEKVAEDHIKPEEKVAEDHPNPEEKGTEDHIKPEEKEKRPIFLWSKFLMPFPPENDEDLDDEYQDDEDQDEEDKEDEEKKARSNRIFTEPLPTPAEMKAELDKYIVGQDEAKRTLCLAVYNHYTALRYNEDHKHDRDFQPLEKSNVLMYGPTGCGKTEIIRQLTKLIHVPMVTCNTSALTSAAYKGKNAQTIIHDLYEAADEDEKLASYGIIYLDEFDKIASLRDQYKNENRADVMQELLCIIEGGVTEHKSTYSTAESMRTDDILFICGGAFEGLDQIIQRRCHKEVAGSKLTIGFNRCPGETKTQAQPQKEKLPKAITEDFLEYGAIREIMGRLPIITCVQALTEADLARIITTTRNSVIQQSSKRLQCLGCKLTVEDAAAKAIAHQAFARGTGARGLRTIVENILSDVMFELPGAHRRVEVVVTEDCVVKGTAPELRELPPRRQLN
jgi:ATP-dependent Clp protease ATP-binding subunit ClpX